jgi:hypothetical protein
MTDGQGVPPTKSMDITVAITFDPMLNAFESHMDPPPGTPPEFFWEALKLHIMNMVKAAAYYQDPIVREQVDAAARAMRLIVLGTGAAIEKMRATRQNIDHENRG